MDGLDLFIAAEYIKEFLSSDTKTLMEAGERYYKAENDVVYSGGISHGFMTNLVDEKVQYLLGKEPTITSTVGESNYLQGVKEVVGKGMLNKLAMIATETSNKGIGWQQVYFDKQGKLAYMIIPSEQVIPVWTDKSHTELKWVIRLYDIEEYQGTQKKTITKAEIYTDTNVFFYEYKSGRLVLDSQKYLPLADGQEYGHFSINGVQYNFGKVPFVWCKNNFKEMSDLKAIKPLIDAYDTSRTNMNSLLEDFKNFMVVIRGYAADPSNVGSVEYMLKQRRVFVDNDGGLEFLSPSIDTTANESHNNTLKDDIILFGRSVDRNKMAGAAPSGIALKALYSGLDLKCNQLETGIKALFEDMLYFVESYLLTKGIKKQAGEVVEIVLNRDVTMNESSVIADCKNSIGVISQETIIANHPFVSDTELELERLAKENSIDMSSYIAGGANG